MNPNHCRDCGISLKVIHSLPGPRCPICWKAVVALSARNALLPQHPELANQPDEIIDAIFDRILRDEGRYQLEDAAKARHERDKVGTPVFDVQAFAATMGLNVIGETA